MIQLRRVMVIWIPMGMEELILMILDLLMLIPMVLMTLLNQEHQLTLIVIRPLICLIWTPTMMVVMMFWKLATQMEMMMGSWEIHPLLRQVLEQ